MTKKAKKAKATRARKSPKKSKAPFRIGKARAAPAAKGAPDTVTAATRRALVADKPADSGGQEPEKVSLEEFFGSVGQALLKAQKMLDQQSADYLASSSGQKHVQRSVFRIPKISAEIKFATQSEKDQGVNVFIYKDETKSQVLNQQTVQFDVVSVPPPPDLPSAPFQVNAVFAKDRRTAILAAIPSSPWGTDAESVLIYEIASGQLLVAYAADSKGNVGFWYVAENPPAAAVLRTFGAQNADAFELARMTIQMLGAKQKQFLSQI